MGDVGVDEQTLVFREQADGRKVSRIGGKVVLIHYAALDEVQDGERWLVRLEHHDTYAVAHPIEKMPPLPPPATRPIPLETLPSIVAGPRPAAPPPSAPSTPATVVAPMVTVAAPPKTAAPIVVSAPVHPDEILSGDERVALFVDAANMDHASREAGFAIDFSKLARFVRSGAHTYGSFYFVADFTQADPLQQRFLDYLSHNGYIVRRKRVKAIQDRETGETRFKADVDVELAVELLNTADNYDVAFIATGDSDYERVVDLLRSRGKRVYVVASRHSLSRELAYVADKPIFYLEDWKDELVREEKTALP